MTIRAFLVIDDGDKCQETVSFDVKPEPGEILHWKVGHETGHAKVVRLEHRQGPEGFYLTVIAETAGNIDDWIKSMVG